MSEKPKITTKDIRTAVIDKYSGNAWVVCFEVGNDTGFGCAGWADAVAMSIWPSRGYQINGFEFKISRQDFLKEMKEPEKAENVGAYCDFWTLITPSGLVQDHEIPEAWGWMTLTPKGRLHTRRAPTRNDAKAISRGFFAAMLRRRADHNTNGIVVQHEKQIAELKAAHEKEVSWKVKQKVEDMHWETARLKKFKEEFEARLGVKLNHWEDPEDIADKLKHFTRLAGKYGKLKDVARDAAGLSELINTLIGEHHE